MGPSVSSTVGIPWYEVHVSKPEKGCQDGLDTHRVEVHIGGFPDLGALNNLPAEIQGEE